MGTVSTALTEEALAKCIKQSTYGHITSMEMMACCSKSAEDEIKCSICQVSNNGFVVSIVLIREHLVACFPSSRKSMLQKMKLAS